MAQIVKLRRSSVSGQKPTNDNLQLGELAVNTTDGKIFLAKSGSLGPTIEEIVTTNTIITGSINLIGGVTVSDDISGSNIKGRSLTVSNGIQVSGSSIISGSLTISGSQNQTPVSIQINGDIRQNGGILLQPVDITIDPTISGSYIFSSGSTNDLYFGQTTKGNTNVTRLRWLEGNLYTGLLNGGLITTSSLTTFNISSGSGIIVTLNASITDDPYPQVKYVKWGNLTNQTLTYLTSSIQTFVGINSDGNIIQQTTPWNDGEYNTSISLGTVIHQNKSTINATITYPNTAYGYKQRTYDFIKAFGPLKLSGLSIIPSGSLGLTIGSGTAFADGRNYQVDPNNPSYIVDPGTTVSKIFRYYQSGSSFVQDTNNGVGYTTIDPVNYNPGGLGVITPIPGGGANREWSIQRVFWYPNSATKGIVVYYGNESYATVTDAIANLSYEPFQEVENTKQNAVYLGAIIVKNNANFTDPLTYKILPGGIFRNVGGSGGGGAALTQILSGLSDVNISGPTGGQALVYDGTTLKWTNSGNITGSLFGNATTSTSSSFLSNDTNGFIQGGNSFGTTAIIGTNDTHSLAIETNGTTRMYISSGGDIGVGTTSPSSKLEINPLENQTALKISNYSVTGSNNQSALDISGTWNTTGTPTLIKANVTNTASSANSLLMNLQVNSINSFGVNQNGGIILGNESVRIMPTAAAFGSSNISGTNLEFVSTTSTQQFTNGAFMFRAGNTITNTIGGSLIFTRATFAPTTSGAPYSILQLGSTINQTGGANGITRGLFINPTLTSAADWRSIEWSNNTGFGLYGAGTAINYLNGGLGIGTTLLNNSNLRISKILSSGVNVNNVIIESAISSTITGTVSSFVSTSTTQNTSFTLNSLRHFSAAPDVKGVSSTITNEIGFFAGSTLVNATNNFGFYGDIASGTGRWNLYMNGTANNFLAGNLGIGTTIPSEKLEVSGNVKAASFIKSGGTSTQYLMADGSVSTLTNPVTGTGTTNYLSKFLSGGTIGNSSIYDDGNNIGIGINSGIIGKFEVVGVSVSGSFIAARFYNNTTNASGVKTKIELPIYNGSSGGTIEEIGNSIDGYRLNIYQSQTSGVITFGTAGDNERMRITSTGDVGIGTLTPSSKLNVVGDQLIVGSSSGTTTLGIQIKPTISVIPVGQVHAYIGVGDTNIGTNGDLIIAPRTNVNASVRIYTGTSPSEKIRIDGATGNLGVGTTTPKSKLDVNGNTTLSGSLMVSQSLIQYSSVALVPSGSVTDVMSFNTGSYTATFFDFVITSGSNSRAGTIFTTWNGNNIEYTETSTNDIGNTTSIRLSTSLTAGLLKLQATSIMGSWSVKTLARMI